MHTLTQYAQEAHKRTMGEYKRLAYRDNKLIDFVSAIACGLAVSYQTQGGLSSIGPLWSTISDVIHTAVYIAAFTLVALVVFQWNSFFRAKYGWTLITIGGSFLCAVADEWILHRGDPDMPQYTSFLIGDVVVYLLLTFPIMAIGDYLGWKIGRRLE